MSRQKLKDFGYSLIECSISIVLVSMILCALIQQYIQLKHHDKEMHTSLDEVMEVQFALDFIRGRIQESGFTPCRALHYLHIVDHRLLKDDIDSITVYPQGIVCRRMGSSFVLARGRSHSRQIKLTKAMKLAPGSFVLIADCEHAELHVITSIKQIEGDIYVELQNPLFFDYPSSFYFGPWVEERFLMKRHATGENVLMYHAKHAEILTDHIQNMQITREMNHVRVLFELKRHGHVMMYTRLRMP